MQIQVYQSVRDMTGKGEEWLIDAQENVRAVFIDGNLACEVFYLPQGNTERTVVPSEREIEGELVQRELARGYGE